MEYNWTIYQGDVQISSTTTNVNQLSYTFPENQSQDVIVYTVKVNEGETCSAFTNVTVEACPQWDCELRELTAQTECLEFTEGEVVDSGWTNKYIVSGFCLVNKHDGQGWVFDIDAIEVESPPNVMRQWTTKVEHSSNDPRDGNFTITLSYTGMFLNRNEDPELRTLRVKCGSENRVLVIDTCELKHKNILLSYQEIDIDDNNVIHTCQEWNATPPTYTPIRKRLGYKIKIQHHISGGRVVDWEDHPKVTVRFPVNDYDINCLDLDQQPKFICDRIPQVNNLYVNINQNMNAEILNGQCEGYVYAEAAYAQVMYKNGDHTVECHCESADACYDLWSMNSQTGFFTEFDRHKNDIQIVVEGRNYDFDISFAHDPCN